MAVERLPAGKSLQIIFDLGMNGDKVKTKTKSYPDLRPAIEDVKVYEVAGKIVRLQEHPIMKVLINEKSELVGD